MRKQRTGFSLIEMLSSIAVIALVIAVSVPFVGSYVKRAKETADRQTLSTLNDALTRYKTQGGLITALTSGAPMERIVEALRTPVEWGGVEHQFLSSNVPVVAASLTGAGSGKGFKFVGYDSYSTVEAVNSGNEEDNTDPLAAGLTEYLRIIPMTDGNLRMEADSSLYVDFFNPGQFAARIGTGAHTVFRGSRSGWGNPATMPVSAGDKVYVFSSDTSGTPSGHLKAWSYAGYVGGTAVASIDLSNAPSLTDFAFNGPYSGPKLSSIDLSSNPGLARLSLSNTNITSLDLSSNPAITYLYLNSNNLTTLNLSSNSNIVYLDISNNPLTSFPFGSLDSLTTLYANYLSLSSIDLSGFSNLTQVGLSSSSYSAVNIAGLSSLTSFNAAACPNLTSLDISGCTSIRYIDISGSGLNKTALEALFSQLPDRSNLSAGRIIFTANPGATSANTTILNTKNWMIGYEES